MEKQANDIQPSNFSLIYNDIDISKGIPADLGNWMVEKPNIKDIPLVSNHFHQISSSFNLAPFQEMTYIGDGNSITYNHNLTPENFRYLIVRSKFDDNPDFKIISEAFRLSQNDLWAESFLYRTSMQGSVGYNPLQADSYFSSMRPTEAPLIINWEYIADIVKLREEFIDKDFPHIADTIKMFTENDAIQDKSQLKHLGYFAIIERLLSHTPSPNDSADSITRQLKRNLILLNNRHEGETDLMMSNFNVPKPDTVISKLYSYRSNIAHGERGTTDLNKLHSLIKNKDAEGWNFTKSRWIGWYLRNLTKGVLIHALREPQLFTDLK